MSTGDYILTLTFDSWNNITNAACRKQVELPLDKDYHLIKSVTFDVADCALNVGQNESKHLLLTNAFTPVRTTAPTEYNEISSVSLKRVQGNVQDTSVLTELQYQLTSHKYAQLAQGALSKASSLNQKYGATLKSLASSAAATVAPQVDVNALLNHPKLQQAKALASQGHQKINAHVDQGKSIRTQMPNVPIGSAFPVEFLIQQLSFPNTVGKNNVTIQIQGHATFAQANNQLHLIHLTFDSVQFFTDKKQATSSIDQCAASPSCFQYGARPKSNNPLGYLYNQ